MARSGNGNGATKSNGLAVKAAALSKRWASRPVKTSADMKQAMQDLYADLVGDRIERANAATMLGVSKHHLSIVINEIKFGREARKGRTLRLT